MAEVTYLLIQPLRLSHSFLGFQPTQRLSAILHHIKQRFCASLHIAHMMEKDTPALAPRLAKTCDQCKARKVRCIGQSIHASQVSHFEISRLRLLIQCMRSPTGPYFVQKLLKTQRTLPFQSHQEVAEAPRTR
jgi:hypothetical protein